MNRCVVLYHRLVESVCEIEDPRTQLEVFQKLEKLMDLQGQSLGAPPHAEGIAYAIAQGEVALEKAATHTGTRMFPEYRLGSPRDRILKYLEQVGMLPSIGKLMHECGIGGLYEAGQALDELLKERLIGYAKRSDGVLEFYLIPNELREKGTQ